LCDKVVYATNTNIRVVTEIRKDFAKIYYCMERIKKLQEFLQSAPRDSFLKHALALEFVKLGDDVKARDLFMEILRDEPGYIGSYYHLAKLFERRGEQEDAIKTYEQGMQEAKKAGDQHSYNELQAAYEDLVF
jgi:Tfp pilus assembly protein PilF